MSVAVPMETAAPSHPRSCFVGMSQSNIRQKIILQHTKRAEGLHHTSQYLLEAFDTRSGGIVVFACHTGRCKLPCRAVQLAFRNNTQSPAQTVLLCMPYCSKEKHLMLKEDATPFPEV